MKDQAKMQHSITLIVPAYNEEKYLEKAVSDYDSMLKKNFNTYEIIIINDGSKDKTKEIAESIKKNNPKVRVFHNNPNKGLGFTYAMGVKKAKMEYITCLPGENELYLETIAQNLRQIGKADLIIPYIKDKTRRKIHRRFVSSIFTNMLNVLFGLKLKYYNGHVIHRRSILKNVKITTNSFAYQAEILIKLLKGKKKYSFVQVPYQNKQGKGQSSCLKIKNLIRVMKVVIRLFFQIHFSKK
jgi:dolichol-phosphate mannosyltransferase